jgi:hypothetical protein
MGLGIKDKLAQFGRVPYGVFLLLFVISLTLTLFALRNNNQEMVRLRAAVYAADKDGGDLEKALTELRGYVHSHMNTDLTSGGNAIKPHIQLKYTFERLVAAEQSKANAANTQLYTEAQNYCQAQIPSSFSGGPRVPCIEEYVTTHGVPASQVNIPASLYKFDFVSPLWTPDLAGWGLLVTTALFIAFVVGFALDRLLRARIKSQEI